MSPKTSSQPVRQSYLAQASQASICRHGCVTYCSYFCTPGEPLPFFKRWPVKQHTTNISTVAPTPADGMRSRVIGVHAASDAPYTVIQDFEQAAWQLTYLCLAPKRVCVCLGCSSQQPRANLDLDIGTSITTSVGNFLHLSVIKLTIGVETKNTWARDDPAILVLLSACLCGEWGLKIAMASGPYILFSCSRGLVGGVFLRYSRLFQTRTTHDPTRFLSRGYGRSHHVLVSFSYSMHLTSS